MQRAGMMEAQDEGALRATRLGYLAVRHQLSPETVIAWRDLINDCAELGREPTFMDVLIAIAGSADFNNRTRADADDLPVLATALNQEPMVLKGVPISDWSPTYAQASGKALVFAVKTALAMRAWTRTGDAEQAAAAVQGQAHEVEEARKETCRLIAAFRAVIALLKGEPREDAPLPDEADLAERMQALGAMIATGMNEQNASLALVEGIGPVWARKLVAANVEDIEDLAQSSADEIVALGGISQARAEAWIDAATRLIEAGGAYRYREAAVRNEVFAAGEGIDYYRWMRAATLEVAWVSSTHAIVTGGSAPHQVVKQAAQWACDCGDAATGNVLCKHVIAVRHALQDSAIPRFGSAFAGEGEEQSLWSVWNGRGSWK